MGGEDGFFAKVVLTVSLKDVWSVLMTNSSSFGVYWGWTRFAEWFVELM